MAHRVAGRKLGRATDHRLALFRNQVTDLLRNEKLITTEAKAREVRTFAEKMITLGKRGDLHARRQALRFVYDKDVVDKVFSSLAPRYRDRKGGYTRMIKLVPRMGDGSRMAQLQLVAEEE
ncbi:MAG TPA: 50S ribosomal protein L17 [Dehalococcoidia bacterium]|jgi:large subunit ribosomal protein L17|nr:50S ribosomal protein L17 [Dehalococcoidia bacterium]